MGQLIVFAGGGTGGHVYPGLAIIKKLRERWKGEVLWVGSTGGMEAGIVGRAGVPFAGIPSGKLRRYPSLRNLVDVFRVAAGFFAALFLFIRKRPALVLSKGGYVSVPPVVAARLLGIPVLTHESDADPGLATRINARFARWVLIPYEESKRFYPQRLSDRLVVTGNPVRGEITAGRREAGLALLGFSGRRPVLFVLGGSLGSEEINGLVSSTLDRILKDYDVVHQTGGPLPGDRPGYRAFAYLNEELPDVFSAADLVVSRAGAGSLWELAVTAKPSLLIPLRGAGTRGDQVRNARVFADRGLAVVLDSDRIEPGEFVAAIHRAHSFDRTRLRAATESFRAADAAGRIAELIIKEVAR